MDATDRGAPPLIWTHPAGGRSQWVVLILAGGGYHHVAISNEARPTADWLADRGVSSAILDYRVAPHRHPIPLADALAAYAEVRAAGRTSVIVWGFSAGGHLAGLLATEADPRPELMILTYPVVSLRHVGGHEGSAVNLLGSEANDIVRARLSIDARVDQYTPSTLLIHGGADHAVPPEHSVLLWSALRRVGVPAELHVYRTGGHGGGLDGGGGLIDWTDRVDDWLRLAGVFDVDTGETGDTGESGGTGETGDDGDTGE